MKNIQISPSYKPAYYYGGPTMSVSKLCEELQIAGLSPIVLTTTANGNAELPAKSVLVDGVAVRYFKRITKDPTHYSPDLFKALKGILRHRQQEPTLIHIHSWWNIVTLFSCWIAKKAKVAVVLSPRGMLTQYTLGNRNSMIKSVIHRFIGQGLIRHCHVHATSEQEKRDILKIITPKSITIIPNFVRFPVDYNTSGAQDDGQFKLIFLARIEEKKGLDILFQSLSQLAFNWRLTIAGAGSEVYVQELKKQASRLNINHQINWIGQVRDVDKFYLLAQHDLMVLPSHNENFANSVVESLAVGTPVLISAHVGLADYVVEHNLGWISVLHPDSFASALTLIHNHASERKRISEQAPSIIHADFHPKKIVGQYLALYDYAIKHG